VVLAMSKIADIVKLKSGYANFVELKSAYEESQENTDRMAMYRPTKAHRTAFERICTGLYNPNDKKFYLLSGSYGTGKSHLCLMLANFLSKASGDPEISGFYDDYAKLDEEKAKKLKNIRKDGQYLVAICEYQGHQFEKAVLKAVFEACRAKGLDPDIETEFDEAERLLAEWQQKGDSGGIRNFYEDFGKALEKIAPALTVEQLRAGLMDFETEMLKKFREAFKATMGGVTFQAQAGNLIPVIQKLVNSTSFKDRFKGLAIFYDEFGFTLGKSSYTKDILQGFMEKICKNLPNVIFVGCIHKDFKTYADRYSQDDAAVMSARITQVDLLNEGIEEIIGAIVETDKDSIIWKNEIEPKTGVFDQLLPLCETLELFPWIKDHSRIRQRVLEDIYGVHPMALSCLLKLSSEIGSDARSTFTFFSGDVGGQQGSYADFIKNADITVDGGKLNLFTTDLLFDFFKKELSQKTPELREGQRQFVNGYYASLDALRKASEGTILTQIEDYRVKLLRVILIYNLTQIPATLDNIQFGLYCVSPDEKKQVNAYLKEMVKDGVVFLRQQSKTYELAASIVEDPYDLIERYIADLNLHPEDLVKAFLEEVGGMSSNRFAEAKGYNLPFTEDKRFKTCFVRAKDLGDNLWIKLRQEYEDSRGNPNNSFEGTLVYALCENDAEIAMAKNAIATIADDNLALAVPHLPQPFTDDVLRVKACRYYLPPNEAIKLSAQTESRLQDIFTNHEDGYLPVLKKIFAEIEEGGSACWYGQDGKVLVDQPKQAHKPADMLCEELYKKRCRIKHANLNMCHDDKWKTGKNTPLKQAITILLEAERVMIDNANPGNHGEKRYLEKVLFSGAGALKKIGSAGTVNYFSCSLDPNAISDYFPVLKTLLERLNNLKPGDTFSVGSFVEEMQVAPFGAGGLPIMLSLAHVVRAYGERLIVYRDSTRMTEQPIRNYEDLAKVVADPSAKTVFLIREISQAQHVLINMLDIAVGALPLKHGENRSLNEVFNNLKQWWNGLPSVAKLTSIYQVDRKARLDELKNLMATLGDGVDRFDFILTQLPGLYSTVTNLETVTEDEAKIIGETFKEDVESFNNGEQLAQKEVTLEICDIFGVTGDIVECEQEVIKWYKELNQSQRDIQKAESEEASFLLKRLAADDKAFSTIVYKLLPEDFGFGAVSNWTSIKVKDFGAKLRQAKTEIEKAKQEVAAPKLDRVQVLSSAEKKVIPLPDGVSRFVYTTDGKDPKFADKPIVAEGSLDLAGLLKDNPRVNLVIRSLDADGNYSDRISAELVNKERKYQIQITDRIHGDPEAAFLWPGDIEGLVAVLNSVLNHGVNYKYLTDEQAVKVQTILNEFIKGK
jgi:energy-coupling factor transporter ATP-binding protein EcfA2